MNRKILFSLETVDWPTEEQRKFNVKRPGRRSHQREEAGFRCTHCHQSVSSATDRSGVRHRNHCPYCLWSRHMDLKRAGDRSCECKARMKPVGLTLKKTHKKYNQDQSGELMLIHLCVHCGKISINRIAADDDAFTIVDTFQSSLRLDAELKTSFVQQGIQVLEEADQEIVHTRLFGKSIQNFHSGC